MTEARPFGGEKLAFEITPGLTGEHAAAQKAFTSIIENAREAKRKKKDEIEKAKEGILGPIDHLSEVLAHNGYDRKKLDKSGMSAKDKQVAVDTLIAHGKIPAKDRKLAIQVVTNSEQQNIEFAKKVLKDFYNAMARSGWDWMELESVLKAKGLMIERVSKDQAYVLHHDGTRIAAVWFGTARLKPKSDAKDVLVQKGYDAEAEFARRRKEYVLDANGVPTRRYLTRQISHFHLANMLGLNYDSITRKFLKDVEVSRRTGEVRAPGQYPDAVNALPSAVTPTRSTSEMRRW